MKKESDRGGPHREDRKRNSVSYQHSRAIEENISGSRNRTFFKY